MTITFISFFLFFYFYKDQSWFKSWFKTLLKLFKLLFKQFFSFCSQRSWRASWQQTESHSAVLSHWVQIWWRRRLCWRKLWRRCGKTQRDRYTHTRTPRDTHFKRYKDLIWVFNFIPKHYVSFICSNTRSVETVKRVSFLLQMKFGLKWWLSLL